MRSSLYFKPKIAPLSKTKPNPVNKKLPVENYPKPSVWHQVSKEQERIRGLTESIPCIQCLAWGSCSDGKLGSNNLTKHACCPTQVWNLDPNETVVSNIAASGATSIIVDQDGDVKLCGTNIHDELGLSHPFLHRKIVDKKSLYNADVISPYQWQLASVTPSQALFMEETVVKSSSIISACCGGRSFFSLENNADDSITYLIGACLIKQHFSSPQFVADVGDSFQSLAKSACFNSNVCAKKFNKGSLFTWGSNYYGQLSQDSIVKQVKYPSPVRTLMNHVIVQVSAGLEHVVARSSDTVFTWGSNSYGKLGIDSYDDVVRYSPQIINLPTSESLLTKIKFISAGYHHSCIVVDGNSSDVVFSFGRGCHGRLGLGHTRHACKPTEITTWPPSYGNGRIKCISCGGAHTLVLVSKKVNKCLANPWGEETTVYSFGFGRNGQLGTGSLTDSSVPMKVKIVKWEHVVEVSAGRSHSLARTILGHMMSWGGNSHGQLGLGHYKSCVTPQAINKVSELNDHSYCVQVSSGGRHSLALVCDNRHASLQLPVLESRSLFDAAIYLGPKPRLSMFSRTVGVCLKRMHTIHSKALAIPPRAPIRATRETKSNIMGLIKKWGQNKPTSDQTSDYDGPGLSRCQFHVYMCVDCGIYPLCRSCMLLEHCKHVRWSIPLAFFALRNIDQLDITCKCSLSGKCKLLSCIPETVLSSAGIDFVFPLEKALVSLQSLVRCRIARNVLSGLQDAKKKSIHGAVVNWWNETLCTDLYRRVATMRENVCLSWEQDQMSFEDSNSKAYQYFSNLQNALNSMRLQEQALSQLIQNSAIIESKSLKESGVMCWSLSSLRNLQLQYLPPKSRLIPNERLEIMRQYPMFCTLKNALYVADPDLRTFVGKFQQDIKIHEIDMFRHRSNATLIRKKKAKDVLNKSVGRRDSISDPSDMYKKTTNLRKLIKNRLAVVRRDSVPDRLSLYYPPKLFSYMLEEKSMEELPYWRKYSSLSTYDEYQASLTKSLSLFKQRGRQFSQSFSKMSSMRYLVESMQAPEFMAFENGMWHYPRRYVDINYWNRKRRRSVADPERLCRTVQYIKSTTTLAEAILKSCSTANLPCRRRSRSYDILTSRGPPQLLSLPEVTKKLMKSKLTAESERISGKLIRSKRKSRRTSMAKDPIVAYSDAVVESKTGDEEVKKEEKTVDVQVKDEWIVKKDDYGNKFYYNPRRGESCWELEKKTAKVEAQAGDEWVRYVDETTGKGYIFNSLTGESKWES